MWNPIMLFYLCNFVEKFILKDNYYAKYDNFIIKSVSLLLIFTGTPLEEIRNRYYSY